MQRITFNASDDPLTCSTPFIPNGTPVILVQDGVAQVGRYQAPTEHEGLHLTHPLNEVELRAEALEAVRAQFPEAMESDVAHIYTCPTALASKYMGSKPCAFTTTISMNQRQME